MTEPVAPAAPAAPVAAPAAPAAPVSAASALMANPAAAAAAAAPVDPAAPAAVAPAAADPADPAAPATLVMPGKDATPEQWADFYKQVGAPETADAYEVSLAEGDAPEVADMVKKMFKEANILPNQAAKLLEFRNKIAAEAVAANEKAAADHAQAMNAKNTAEAQALQNEWGEAHTENMELARRAIRQFIPGEKASETIAAIEGVLGYKGVIQFLHGIGKGLGESDAAGLSNGNSGLQTPMQSLASRLYAK